MSNMSHVQVHDVLEVMKSYGEHLLVAARLRGYHLSHVHKRRPNLQHDDDAVQCAQHTLCVLAALSA